MGDNLTALIRALEPGKHFLGLWVYRQWRHRNKPARWVVTFWDRRGEYYETGLHATPRAALLEAKKVLSAQENG